MTPQRRPSLVDQVREALRAEITSGKLPSGAKLPNEAALADRFTVSRSTIREAVGSLMDAGYLARRHGSGTFVTAFPRAHHPLETTVSYTGMIRDAGHAPTEMVLGMEVREPVEDERELLGLTDGSLMEVERVRLADGEPVIYSRDRIPTALLSGASDDALDSSLYAILAEAGHPVARATARLSPTVAGVRLARLLKIKRGAPLLRIDQVDYDDRGRAVMLSAEWHVAGAFELIVHRRASSSSGEA